MTGGVLVFFESGVQVTRNSIGNILRSDGTTGLSGTAFGIALGVVPSNSVTAFTGSDVTGAVVTGNKIDGVVQLDSTGYSAFGIVVNSVTSGTTFVANNMVSGVRSAATASDFTGGVVLGGGTGSTTQFYANSVSMTGSRNAATYPSYALAVNSGDPSVDVKDNILYNTQTSSSSGKSYAIATGGATFANLASDFNDLFASGAAGVVGQTGGLGTAGTDRAALSNWRTATGKDAASISADPVFVSTSDLHISLCATSPVSNAGAFIGTVTTDYDGDARSVTTPDIGADEFAPAIPCNDSNACTTDTCNPLTGCIYTPVSDGTFCGDAETECTNQDTCVSGACQDNGFKAPGTTCGSGSDTDCDNPDTCNGSGACQSNNETNGTSCGDAGTECTNQDTCMSGACQDNGFKAPGTTCGSGSDTECDNPDTCNGSGSCQINNEANGHFCGDPGTECTNQDTCQGGACQDNGYQPSGHACGSSADTECDNPDTCNGSGSCQLNNESDGHLCGDAGTECTNQDTCQSGACQDNGYQAPGTACGSSADTECDNPDMCDGGGACQSNHEADGHVCGDAGTECTNQDTCQGGACQDNGYQPAGHACGSSTDTECDNPDTCNGSGSCALNNESDGHLCGDAGTECTNQDTCVSGACQDNGYQAPGTACGSGADTECDNPDMCDGGGTCQLNNEADGHVCGDAGTECTNQDTCQSGACQDNGYQPSGHACGSSTDTDCDNPDTCNGSGSCQVNNEANGHVCGDAGTECTNQDTCQSGACQDNGYQPSGHACGSATDTECDNPDTCSGSGSCQANYEASGHACSDGLGCTTGDNCNSTGSCVSTGTVNCDDGSVCTTHVCVEPGGTCSGSTTGSCDINGTVRYYRNNVGPAEPSTKGIPDETVSRTSSTEGPASASTDATGHFSFTSEGGNITLTPAAARLMTDDAECHGAITASDATAVARGVVLIDVLTPSQQIAADVSNNGVVSSFDAALIAQKSVSFPCLAYSFPVRTATGSDWAFRPVSRSYTPLTGVGEDYSFLGVLYGDVTGNWTAPALFSQGGGAPAAPSPETSMAEASPRIPVSVFQSGSVAVVTPGAVDAVDAAAKGALLYLAGAPTQNPDGTWTLVLGLQRADGILGLDMALRYDAEAIHVRNIAATGLGAAWTAAGNSGAGEYRVALFGVQPLAGSGSFLTVTYEMAVHVDGLPFAVDAQANEGRIPISWAGAPRGSNDPQIRVDE